jgi:hypothetical protein
VTSLPSNTRIIKSVRNPTEAMSTPGNVTVLLSRGVPDCVVDRHATAAHLAGGGGHDQTEDEGAAYAAAGLATVWLMLGALTAAGARRRGRRWPRALLSGLLFPVTWVQGPREC